MAIKKDYEDCEAMNSPPLTYEELARLKPATEVLPASFFKYLDNERRKRGRPPIASPKKAITLRRDSNVIAFLRRKVKTGVRA